MNTLWPALSGVLGGVAHAAEEASFWMPPQASTYAADVDFTFYYIYFIDVACFIVMMGAMFYFVANYRMKKEGEKVPDIKGSHALEIGWSVLPGILMVGMFWFGFQGWMDMAVPPSDAMEVRVIGQKWNWTYQYNVDGTSFEVAGNDEDCMEKGTTPDKWNDCTAPLVVPAGTPVKLVMNSRDVLHSYYVPDFRMKKDVVPGRYTVAWFEAPEPGTHKVFCTEYCGDQHGYMYSRVEVKPQAEFDAWIKEQVQAAKESGSLTGAALGEKLYAAKGCAGCHKIDGTRLVGPPLNGLFGKEEKLEGGETVKVDEEYLRESILVPAAKIVAGYPPAMTPYQGILDEREVEGLVEYIKTLSE
jgi:cytochrome c oxidase subunit 2